MPAIIKSDTFADWIDNRVTAPVPLKCFVDWRVWSAAIQETPHPLVKV
ncbi:MAG: hypothetical protein ABW199_02465 [Caulobacterales bacterium]